MSINDTRNKTAGLLGITLAGLVLSGSPVRLLICGSGKPQTMERSRLSATTSPE